MSPGKALQIAGAALSTDLAFTNVAADSFRRHHRRPADAGSNSVCGRAESRMCNDILHVGYRTTLWELEL